MFDSRVGNREPVLELFLGGLVVDAAASPGGDYVAAALAHRTAGCVGVWDLRKAAVGMMAKHPHECASVAWASEGTLMTGGRNRGELRTWRVARGDGRNFDGIADLEGRVLVGSGQAAASVFQRRVVLLG